MFTDSVVAMTNAATSTRMDMTSGGTFASLPARPAHHEGVW